MKKLFLVAVLVFFGSHHIEAQSVRFGATGGLFYGTADTSIYGYSIKEISGLVDYDLEDLEVLDGGGFFVGFLADIELIDKIHVQPELLYANAGGESLIIIPVMAKYYIAKAFNLQGGLQFDFLLDPPSFDFEGVALTELIKDKGMSINLGAGYDINDKFAIQAKYSFGTTNRVEEDNISGLLDSLGLADLGGILSQLLNGSSSLKTNILQIGVIYKF